MERYRYTIYKPFGTVREIVEFSEKNSLELYLGAIPKDCVCRIDRAIEVPPKDGQHWLFPEEGTNDAIWEKIALLRW